MEEIRQALEGAQLVFLCVGLGGGTGSGAARIVASLAREQKALVISFATLPFTFEGKRRRGQADEALSALQRYSDIVIHFENDRMGDSVAPLASIQEAFTVADQTLSQSIRAIARLVRQRGLVHIGFDELATAMRAGGDSGAHCIFGYGEADGDNRAHEALARALKNPLMDKGKMLEDARNVLVNIAGGPSMTLNEVQILMEEFNRQHRRPDAIAFRDRGRPGPWPENRRHDCERGAGRDSRGGRTTPSPRAASGNLPGLGRADAHDFRTRRHHARARPRAHHRSAPTRTGTRTRAGGTGHSIGPRPGRCRRSRASFPRPHPGTRAHPSSDTQDGKGQACTGEAGANAV